MVTHMGSSGMRKTQRLGKHMMDDGGPKRTPGWVRRVLVYQPCPSHLCSKLVIFPRAIHSEKYGILRFFISRTEELVSKWCPIFKVPRVRNILLWVYTDDVKRKMRSELKCQLQCPHVYKRKSSRQTFLPNSILSFRLFFPFQIQRESMPKIFYSLER